MTNNKLGKMVDAKLSKWAEACALNGHPLVTFTCYGKTIERPYCLCGKGLVCRTLSA